MCPPPFFVSGAPALVPVLFCMAAPSLSFCPSACTFPTRPPRTCHHLILRTLAPAHLALASAVTFTVDHTSFLSPCCTASSPLFSVPAPCPPNAATPPTHTCRPSCLHPRSLRPLPYPGVNQKPAALLPTSSPAPAVSFTPHPTPRSPPPDPPHPVITHPLSTAPPVARPRRPRPCNTSSPLPARSPYPAKSPSLRLSDFPTSRKVGKPESRQVGKRTRTTSTVPAASAPAALLTLPAARPLVLPRR